MKWISSFNIHQRKIILIFFLGFIHFLYLIFYSHLISFISQLNLYSSLYFGAEWKWIRMSEIKVIITMFYLRHWAQNIADRRRVRKLKLRKQNRRELPKTQFVVSKVQQIPELVGKFQEFPHLNSIRRIKWRIFRTCFTHPTTIIIIITIITPHPLMLSFICKEKDDNLCCCCYSIAVMFVTTHSNK
jgi:hypothetical protein